MSNEEAPEMQAQASEVQTPEAQPVDVKSSAQTAERSEAVETAVQGQGTTLPGPALPDPALSDPAAPHPALLDSELPHPELPDPALSDPALEAAPQHVPVETRTQIEVELVRSVRYGPIMVVGAAIGAVLLGVAALFFPVSDDAEYELGQVVGLMAVVGAAIGLALGGILALILGLVAKRSRGAALAVQTDVR